MRPILFTIFLLGWALLASPTLYAQNVTVTDDENYNAHASAMLDVKSNTKGMLVPRLTTTERMEISSPANGLMVYDTDLSKFVFFNGTDWLALPQVKSTVASDESLFEVVNASGDTVFAVYPDGVRISIPDQTTKGQVNGFAISGRNTMKQNPANYMTVQSSQTKISYNKSQSKGQVNGFAISGRNTLKSTTEESVFSATLDSTRVYVNQAPLGKGSVNGFAISGRNTTKSDAPHGFFDITRDNYIIGHLAGGGLSGGMNNIVLGFQAGQYASGDNNIYIGSNAGNANTNGIGNVFIGNGAGSNSEGLNHQFILDDSSFDGMPLIAGDFEQSLLTLGANVGVLTDPDPQYVMNVAGTISATGYVGLKQEKPDYVFSKDYDPLSIEEVSGYIRENKHLPWLTPWESEKDKGIDLARMGVETLEAVENMQLQIIQLNEKLKSLHQENQQLQAKLEDMDKIANQNNALQKRLEEIERLLETKK